ncbi:BhlA/UviB family holin-like peptide [Sarcina ventriculi]|uniref:BhlA/UviB family holin-like peptide n=1 Tax=Sarcina ventriculi TaxID=1267 RepID=UPI001C0FFE7E|nr:BhlA/UviB family holin-like peptide [Sarcina ventriculi]MBU5323656.1 bacteriocin [Sarcina ventriculi]
MLEQSLVKLIVSQGIFAVLFVYLLFYVLKENSKRENNYQKIVTQLSNYFPNIEEKLDNISNQLKVKD